LSREEKTSYFLISPVFVVGWYIAKQTGTFVTVCMKLTVFKSIISII